MIHPTYTHKGVSAFLLRLSRAKRRCVLHRRVIESWAQAAYNAQTRASRIACDAVIADAARRAADARAEVIAIERALGVRK